MTEQEFFEQVKEVLEAEEDIGPDTDLEDIEEFDSLGILNLMTMYDEMGIEADQDDLAEAKKGSDLAKLAGDKIDG